MARASKLSATIAEEALDIFNKDVAKSRLIIDVSIATKRGV